MTGPSPSVVPCDDADHGTARGRWSWSPSCRPSRSRRCSSGRPSPAATRGSSPGGAARAGARAAGGGRAARRRRARRPAAALRPRRHGHRARGAPRVEGAPGRAARPALPPAARGRRARGRRAAVRRRARGQAAVELLAVLPLLVLAGLLAWQLMAVLAAGLRAEQDVRSRALAASGPAGEVVVVTATAPVPAVLPGLRGLASRPAPGSACREAPAPRAGGAGAAARAGHRPRAGPRSRGDVRARAGPARRGTGPDGRRPGGPLGRPRPGGRHRADGARRPGRRAGLAGAARRGRAGGRRAGRRTPRGSALPRHGVAADGGRGAGERARPPRHAGPRGRPGGPRGAGRARATAGRRAGRRAAGTRDRCGTATASRCARPSPRPST